MNAKEIIQKIDGDALFALCEMYDDEEEVYPETPYEGAAVYRFFRNVSAKEMERKSGFVKYIEENRASGSLREMFYNYFIAHLGTLPKDDRVCKEEIKQGIDIFLGGDKDK